MPQDDNLQMVPTSGLTGSAADDQIARNFARVFAVTRSHWQAQLNAQHNAKKAQRCNRALPRRFGLMLAHATSLTTAGTNA